MAGRCLPSFAKDIASCALGCPLWLLSLFLYSYMCSLPSWYMASKILAYFQVENTNRSVMAVGFPFFCVFCTAGLLLLRRFAPKFTNDYVIDLGGYVVADPGPGLAKWQGGDIHIVTVTNFRGRGETTYRVDWVSGEATTQISLHWPEKPTVRILGNGKLGLVVGKPGEYNVKVYDAPQGPSTAEHVVDRKTGEEKLKGM